MTGAHRNSLPSNARCPDTTPFTNSVAPSQCDRRRCMTWRSGGLQPEFLAIPYAHSRTLLLPFAFRRTHALPRLAPNPNAASIHGVGRPLGQSPTLRKKTLKKKRTNSSPRFFSATGPTRLPPTSPRSPPKTPQAISHRRSIPISWQESPIRPLPILIHPPPECGGDAAV